MLLKLQHISLLILSFISISVIGQVQDTVKYPINYKAQKDIVYTKVGKWEGKLDFYFPIDSKKLSPLVINIHGGGWNHGTKESQTGFGSFFKNGFAVANVEYRLVDQGTAPSAIEDVRCALLYLVENANQLNIDVNKIVIMGGSAGGHLALMAGLLGKDSRFDTNCNKTTPFKIAAIINKYGVTDLSSKELYKTKMVQNWLGKYKEDLEFAKSVSPLYYVTKNSPPTFVVHGNADQVVPFSQSEILVEKLIKVQFKAEFIIVENGGHGKFSKEENKKVSDAMWKFLKELGL